MAKAQGSDERGQRHLESARDLRPDHPALLIVEARTSADPQYMLDHVADVEPETDAERALLHQTRAQALLNLGDEKGARAEFELALAADPDSDSVREFGAILPWWSASRKMERGEPLDLDALTRAAKRFESLAEELLAAGRSDEAALVTARSAECFLFCNDFSDALRLLEGVLDPERLSPESAIAVAAVGVALERPDLVLRTLPSDSNDPAVPLMRAEAEVQTLDADSRQQGVEALKEFLDNSSEPIALQAAFALIAAAASHVDVAWDERAAAMVASHQREPEAAMRAERALLLGDPGEAQRILLPHAGRPASLRRLRDYAALAGEWEKVKDRSRQLLMQASDPRDRLALAEAYRHLGARAGAEREYRAVAGDAAVGSDLREAAFGGLADVAGADRDYDAIRGLAEEWYREFPDRSNAVWNLLFALARLSRHDDAWRLFDERRPEADTPQRATLLAEILQRAAPKPIALPMLIELSDRFNREEEALEALVIAVALDAESDAVEFDPAIQARVRETFASFPTRFPDSKVIRQFSLPETPDGIVSFLREMAGDGPRLQHEISEEIAAGRAPVNALAAVSSGGVGKTWSGIGALPLRFAMDEPDAADDETARKGLGAAAVWDPSSLFVLVDLLPELEQSIRLALPGSMIATETLQDADRDLGTPGRPKGTTAHTVEGEVSFREYTEEELAREERRAHETLRLAKTLQIEPAKGANADQQLLDDFNSSVEQPEFNVLLASLLLAQRTGRPVYSDDRFIRETARSIGLDAFDSLALLDALLEHGFIDAESRATARRALAWRGGWGVRLDPDELVAAARATGFRLTVQTRSALQDRARWRSDPAQTCRSMLGLLAVVYQHDPGAIGQWLNAVLMAAEGSVPDMPKSWWVEVLMMLSWFPRIHDDAERTDQNAFVRTLLEAAKALDPELTDPGYDPVLGPINRILVHFEGNPPVERYAIFKALTDRLSDPDRLRAVEAFVKPASADDRRQETDLDEDHREDEDAR